MIQDQIVIAPEPQHGTVFPTSMVHAGPWAAWQNPRVFSLSGWFLHTNVGVNQGIEVITIRSNDHTYADGFGVFYTRTGLTGTVHAFVNTWDGSGDGGLIQVPDVTDHLWNHFVLQVRPKQHGFDSMMAFWFNGIPILGFDAQGYQNTRTIPNGVRYGTLGERFIFGNDLTAPVVRPFLGRLGDFALYPRWMNKWEITDIYRSWPIPENQKA